MFAIWHVTHAANFHVLTGWGRDMHIYQNKLGHHIIGSGNGLLPVCHQAIIYTNAGLLLALEITFH